MSQRLSGRVRAKGRRKQCYRNYGMRRGTHVVEPPSPRALKSPFKRAARLVDMLAHERPAAEQRAVLTGRPAHEVPAGAEVAPKSYD